MGSRAWEKKVNEIEVVALQYEPDIIVITEANLKADLPVHERDIRDMICYYPEQRR